MTHNQPPRPRRVIVTGAAGHLGAQACAVLRQFSGTEVVGLDCKPAEQTTIADLLAPCATWAHHFKGADAILHLAGASGLNISEATARREIDGVTTNVLNAAALHKVPRIIYASSCEVLAGAADLGTLDGTTPAAPLNPYAAAKARMENAGRTWAAEPGRSFLALRIGMQLKSGQPTPEMQLSLWKQRLWLSSEDWQQAVSRACTHTAEGFLCVAITSNNSGMAWNLEHARESIGYVPTTQHKTRSRAHQQMAQLTRRLRQRILPSSRTARQK